MAIAHQAQDVREDLALVALEELTEGHDADLTTIERAAAPRCEMALAVRRDPIVENELAGKRG